MQRVFESTAYPAGLWSLIKKQNVWWNFIGASYDTWQATQPDPGLAAKPAGNYQAELQAKVARLKSSVFDHRVHKIMSAPPEGKGKKRKQPSVVPLTSIVHCVESVLTGGPDYCDEDLVRFDRAPGGACCHFSTAPGCLGERGQSSRALDSEQSPSRHPAFRCQHASDRGKGVPASVIGCDLCLGVRIVAS